MLAALQVAVADVLAAASREGADLGTLFVLLAVACFIAAVVLLFRREYVGAIVAAFVGAIVLIFA